MDYHHDGALPGHAWANRPGLRLAFDEPGAMPLLLRCRYFDSTEAVEWAVDEEHFDRELWLDVGGAQEGEHLAVRQFLDRVLLVLGHHALEVLAHLDHARRLASVDHRLLGGGEATGA